MSARACEGCHQQRADVLPCEAAGDMWLCGKCVQPYLPGAPAAPNGSDPAPGRASREPRSLKFVSAAELRSTVPPEPPWVWAGYLSPGTTVMFAGKPKAGKSTFAWAVAEAVAAGIEFLSRAVTGGAVVYVSEEGAGTLRHKLPNSERIYVLTRDAAWPKPPWADLIAAAVAHAAAVGAMLLVIDALSFWAAFGEGQENDTGAAQAVMDALGAATSAGLAVLLVHHQRKGGGENGDAVRGNTAIFGAVDVLVEIERLGEDAPAGQRRLVAVGRWPQTPAVLVVERDATHGSWRVIGEAADRGEANALGVRERILRAAPSEEPGATEPELAELLGLDKRKVSEPLRQLVDDEEIARVGGGKRGDPYRYHRPVRDAAPDSAPDGAASALEKLPLPVRGQHEDRDPDSAPWAASTGGDLEERAERLMAEYGSGMNGGHS